MAAGEDPTAELQYWRRLAEERGRVIRALHEFNYWHASTVARGEVIAGLERSVEAWRDRCLECEAQLAIGAADGASGRSLARRLAARAPAPVRDVAARLRRRPPPA